MPGPQRVNPSWQSVVFPYLTLKKDRSCNQCQVKEFFWQQGLGPRGPSLPLSYMKALISSMCASALGASYYQQPWMMTTMTINGLAYSQHNGHNMLPTNGPRPTSTFP